MQLSSSASVCIPCACCRRAWSAFFRQRWQQPRRILGGWQQAYASKVNAAKGYAEQCRTDSLFGHGGAVRACCLIPACNAVVTGAQINPSKTMLWLLVCLWRKTWCHCPKAWLLPPVGSQDQTVRVWDLKAGLPLAASRPLGTHVRCVAADDGLIVCATSCDPAIRVWRPSEVMMRQELLT